LERDTVAPWMAVARKGVPYWMIAFKAYLLDLLVSPHNTSVGAVGVALHAMDLGIRNRLNLEALAGGETATALQKSVGAAFEDVLGRGLMIPKLQKVLGAFRPAVCIQGKNHQEKNGEEHLSWPGQRH